MTKLSIIIVTFNAKKGLEETLESVFSQTYDNYEVVVIDGVSTDGTLDVVRENQSRIGHWVSEPDRGIYDAMNKGIKAANGQYIQFLNAGDVFVGPNVLEGIFSRELGLTELIYGEINMVNLDGTAARVPAKDFSLQQLLSFGTGVLCHQAMFVLREIAPFYDTRYQFKGELNWYFDLVETEGFSFVKIDQVIVNYELGGWGYQNFLRNRIDWLRLVYNRYGMKAIIDSGLIPYLWRNSFFRYPFLRKLDRTIRLPFRALRKAANAIRG